MINELHFSDKQTGRKKNECLEAYLDADSACWEQVVKVVAEFPFLNKRLARQIANKQNVDYSSVVKDELYIVLNILHLNCMHYTQLSSLLINFNLNVLAESVEDFGKNVVGQHSQYISFTCYRPHLILFPYPTLT